MTMLEVESAKLIFGLLFALLGVFGYLAFMVTVVIVAEFVRRERTETKEDDWWEGKKRD